jgi:signal transduction histidine kinase/ligand-binding sensor domain-containing protein
LRNSCICPEAPLWRGTGRFLAAVLAVIAGAYPVRAVDPSRMMSQYVIERWGVGQGFPRGPVYSIGQAADGYLLVGTLNGLLRFDGLRFEQMHSAEVEALLERVVGVTTDSQGVSWLQLSNSGSTLIRYEHGVFRNAFAGLPTLAAVNALSRGRDGTALCLVNHHRGASGGRSAADTIAACGTVAEAMVSSKKLPQSDVLAFAQTSDGALWLGTTEEGLFRVSNGQVEVVSAGLPDRKVNALCPSKNGELWIATDAGVVRWDGAKLTQAGIPESLRGIQVLSILVDHDSNVWLGTNSQGLLRLNSHGVSALAGPDSGKSDAITALFEDRERSLWAGGGAGLVRLRDSPFIAYSSPEGLPSSGGSPVFADSAGRTWFAPSSGGLQWFRNELHGTVITGGLDRDLVYSIAGRNDDLWIGRQRRGLTHLRLQGASPQSVTYTQTDGLAQNSVYSVYEARDGTVWAGTLSGGVTHVGAGRPITYNTANGLISNTVNSTIETPDGAMWFATPAGLSVLSQGRLQSFTTSDGLPSNEANCLLLDSAGVLWVGTAAGLAFRSSPAFKAPVGATGSLLEPILGMAEDYNGWLWIATANHVLRVNRAKLQQGPLAKADIREYGLADGLRGVEGVKRDRSVARDASGRIWFSVNGAVVVVDPARLANNEVPAIANIQAVSVDGKALSVYDGVHIPGGAQRITFDFVGLGLANPQRVRFRFLLEGYDHQWGEQLGTRQASYTNLGPSRYRFRVAAASPDGGWSLSDATLSFQVDPLFWQAWWFRSSLVAACILALLVLHLVRVKQMAHQLNIRFEERVEERTRIARELHDTMLQSFQGLMLRLQSVHDLLPSGKAKERLEQSLERADQAIAEGRRAVHNLRSPAAAGNDLAEALRVAANEFIGDRSTVFRLVVEGSVRELHPILRDEVYRIACEALRNAFNHAQANLVEAEITYGDRLLRLRIRDDGSGIPTHILESGRSGHYGLSGMRERAQQSGAKLAIWSGSGAGTEIDLSVPASLAYRKSQGRFRWRLLTRKVGSGQ